MQYYHGDVDVDTQICEFLDKSSWRIWNSEGLPSAKLYQACYQWYAGQLNAIALSVYSGCHIQKV